MNEMKTDITAVAVFRDGARVTRSGKTSLDTGPQRVVVTGITSYAQEDSFRVKGRGPATLSKIDVRRTHRVFEPKDDLKPLYEELKKLEREHKGVNDEIELEQNKLEVIGGVMADFSGHFGMLYAAKEANMEQLSALDAKTEKMHANAKTKLRKLQEKLEEIEEQLQATRQNIGKIEGTRRTETYYEVEISVEAKQKAALELDITYQVGSANWSPTYDIDVPPGKAIVRRIAMISNRTREAWNKVKLVVSTATAQPVQAIEGSPFIISVYVPRPVRAERSRSMGRMVKEAAKPMAVPSMAPGAPPPPPEMEEEFAEASESVSGISVYELPKPVTIPFDNERHPVTLIEEDFESTTIHYWYTDGMSEVVAQDEITNADTVLLPGKAAVYSEGDFIGKTTVDLVSPREKFKLGTRTAYDLKATKKMVDREAEKAGITRAKLRRSYKYRLEIESFSKRSAKMHVVDRIPHSLNPSIEVKIDWEKIGAEKHELGVMEWLFDLEPKAKKQIEYEYEVQWDRNTVISPPLP
ncbi:MAG: mucoidy inhibitor MuiA family protein [Candidatus Thorarchaeota archaeon]|nr:mucoidy inhibitor MuiA family protein [Candidatus Thorarchaeota archaeon]